MKPSNIGDLLIKDGKITQEDAEKIVRLQKQQELSRFGEVAKASKLITEKDVQQALSQQFSFSFLTDAKSGLSRKLIAAYQPFSPSVEVLRTIRTQLMLRWFYEGKKTLAIVSASQGEGRSYFTANLAIVFAQLGQRTLLIDANLRQPAQHSLFNLPDRQGLSNFLADRADMATVINQIPELPNLSILTAGTQPPNPLEIISRGLSMCLEKLTHHYDIILLDTPAISQGSDVQLLAIGAGGALLLAKQHETRLAEMETMKIFLEKSGVVCVGAVINHF